jgi:hypothetical protein
MGMALLMKARTDLFEISDSEEIASDPKSLVGSYFLGNSTNTWQGVVVAEPVTGVYLVELFSWISGASTEQRLVRISSMLDWTFYDDSKWMTNAADHIQRVWDKANGNTE